MLSCLVEHLDQAELADHRGTEDHFFKLADEMMARQRVRANRKLEVPGGLAVKARPAGGSGQLHGSSCFPGWDTYCRDVFDGERRGCCCP